MKLKQKQTDRQTEEFLHLCFSGRAKFNYVHLDLLNAIPSEAHSTNLLHKPTDATAPGVFTGILLIHIQ